MTIETLAILGIVLIIGLITLGVVVVAYKASPAQQVKGDRPLLSPSQGRQERGHSADAPSLEVGTRGRHGVANGDI
jgi:hypothetical protein